MREYEIMISGTIVVEAENEADAIDEALTNGCDEYYAEVIDSWEIDDEENDRFEWQYLNTPELKKIIGE